ncbi:hypothetical protein IPT12_02995 [Xanthomonas perforans]|uniref:hypothetical protein n=1 Tax=Xanthomonas perforans TaxID=442694 RepID=UPI000AEB8273|nr:hypothetical protein [Xanthomonas perforans]MBZ2411433.1 hypothetical protein [Xanthomonas perforans]MBZ2415750.1 hypothetical protein [Xanthomonas perforans]MBZ2420015.1 hypothetical protein [Xanthomonas perforans]MBZ2424307.1 hypothetical protein [Xanthomonas perforans]MBZ2428232.1 hypothetical protein [Xanthomonas perforans]
MSGQLQRARQEPENGEHLIEAIRRAGSSVFVPANAVLKESRCRTPEPVHAQALARGQAWFA